MKTTMCVGIILEFVLIFRAATARSETVTLPEIRVIGRVLRHGSPKACAPRQLAGVCYERHDGVRVCERVRP